MKRAFLAIAIAFFGLAVSVASGTPVSAQTPAATAAAAAAPAPGITGDWAVQATGDQLIVGMVHLTRVGDTIVGSSKTPDGSILQINGTMKDNVLSAKWRGPKGNVGWMTLTFNDGMSGFNGNWGYGGRNPNGSIVGRQIAQTEF